MVGSNARFRGASTRGPGQNRSPTSTSQPNSPNEGPQGSQSGQAAQGTQGGQSTQGGHSSSTSAPRIPPLPTSPSLAQNIGMDETNGNVLSGEDLLNSYHLPRPLPLWLNANYAKHIVKGNFMTLSARPRTVEQGEWIAHQGQL